MPTLSFKTNPQEARAIKALAKKEGRTLSDYLRRKALPESRTTTEFRLVRSKITGALVVVGPPDTPALTSEAVNNMLGDFP